LGKAVAWCNGVGVAVAMVLATLAARPGWFSGSTPDALHLPATNTGVALRTMTDAGGKSLTVRRFTRIASGDLVVDRLLLELCEPDRIVAFSDRAPYSYEAFRYVGKPPLPELNNVEGVLALKPDLVIVHTMGKRTHAEQLRQAGVAVFELGEMLGLRTLLFDMEAVGQLIGHPDRANGLRERTVRRLANVSAGRPESERKEALYLGVHGGILYGGTRGSSFHDVLSAAGLKDIAATQHTGWPRFTNEQILAFKPMLIVTQSGMARVMCQTTGFTAVPACGPGGRIVELPTELLVDPGLPLVDAAESLAVLVYGKN
jgi:iron complex transport system substrate-binding protein